MRDQHTHRNQERNELVGDVLEHHAVMAFILQGMIQGYQPFRTMDTFVGYLVLSLRSDIERKLDGDWVSRDRRTPPSSIRAVALRY